MNRRHFISSTTQAALAVTFVACAESDPYAGIERPSLLIYMDETQLLELGALYADMERSVNASGNIQSDFENGETVVVNGWVISLTEAEECKSFYQAVKAIK